MDLVEKERRRLERHRLYQRRYRQKQADKPKPPPPVPCHMPREMRERLDYLVMVHKPRGGQSEFMRRAFEFYAAHLLGVEPPVEAAGQQPAQAPDQAEPGRMEIPTEPPPPVEAPEQISAQEEPPFQEEPFWHGYAVEAIPTAEPPPPVRAVVSKDERIRGISGKPVLIPETPKIKVPGRREKVEKTLIDAEKRVPVRIEFTRKHHHIPWGMRHIMWDNGLQHRGNIWRGRLTPDYAETLREQVAEFGGTLEITGGLGEAPKWGTDWGVSNRKQKQPETT